MTDATKYVVVIIAKAYPGVNVKEYPRANVKEGDRFIVREGEYGPTCSFHDKSMGIYEQPVLFSTFEDAERAVKEWQPHPWYVEKKSYEIVKVRPVYKQVLSGWEKTDE